MCHHQNNILDDDANDKLTMNYKALRRREIPVYIPLGIFALTIFYYTHQIPVKFFSYYELLKNTATSGKCRIPKVDPYDPSILKYISKPKPLVCKQLQPSLTYLEAVNGTLVINRTAAEESGLRSIRCKYRCFYHDTGVSDDAVKYDNWIDLDNYATPGCEFIEVSCSHGLAYSYHFCWAQIIPKPKALPRPLETTVSTVSAAKLPKLNVIVIGIDSMSRSNMVRQLPKSLEYLEQSLNAIVFRGHSKVGDNTWVNLIAMLTGKLVESTKEFATELDDSTYDRYFDDYAQYIWRNYSQLGYRTFYAEDRPDINTFNYAPKKGFKLPPVDHYMRPYWLGSYWSMLHRRSSAFCYDRYPEHELLFEWLYQLMSKYNSTSNPVFGILWWQNLSHDVLNLIGVGDDYFRQFLLRIRPFLENTVLLVVSDHGHRYDSIRESIVGRIEARMPYLAMVVPDWFRRKYPRLIRNAEVNAEDRLTTQFDFYSTLVDLLHARFEQSDSSNVKYSLSGLSLFRLIPEMRSCYAARVPEEYCPCYREIALNKSEPAVRSVALFAVDYVNSLLAKHSNACALLTLADIRDAFIFLPSQKLIKDPQVGKKSPLSGFHINYRVQFETNPNGALLEGVVQHIIDTDQYRIDGDIDRNNKYGNTSYCVSHPRMKKYCYCKIQPQQTSTS